MSETQSPCDFSLPKEQKRSLEEQRAELVRELETTGKKVSFTRKSHNDTTPNSFELNLKLIDQERKNGKKTKVVVALNEEGSVAGYIEVPDFKSVDSDGTTNKSKILYKYVSSVYRGAGVAQSLFAHMAEVLITNGVMQVECDITEGSDEDPRNLASVQSRTKAQRVVGEGFFSHTLITPEGEDGQYSIITDLTKNPSQPEVIVINNENKSTNPVE